MLPLYNILVDNRTRVISMVLNRVPRDVRAYSRVPRAELRESVEHLYDAYLELLASESDERLRQMFVYIARVRVAQAFRLSAILRALLSFNAIIRPILQESYRDIDGDGRKAFNLAMAKIESTTFESVATFSDVFQDYLQNRVDEHNQYLQQKNRQLGIDLSKFVLFRA
jgi:hypothetical protein